MHQCEWKQGHVGKHHITTRKEVYNFDLARVLAISSNYYDPIVHC